MIYFFQVLFSPVLKQIFQIFRILFFTDFITFIFTNNRMLFSTDLRHLNTSNDFCSQDWLDNSFCWQDWLDNSSCVIFLFLLSLMLCSCIVILFHMTLGLDCVNIDGNHLLKSLFYAGIMSNLRIQFCVQGWSVWSTWSGTYIDRQPRP